MHFIETFMKALAVDDGIYRYTPICLQWWLKILNETSDKFKIIPLERLSFLFVGVDQNSGWQRVVQLVLYFRFVPFIRVISTVCFENLLHFKCVSCTNKLLSNTRFYYSCYFKFCIKSIKYLVEPSSRRIRRVSPYTI